MNRVAFSIFNIDIYWYSICILLGIVVAYFVITKESKKYNISSEFITNLMFYSIVIGILGARLYYVVFNFNYYINHLNEIFAIRNGGLAIHGGLIAGFIVVYLYTKKHNVNLVRILDIIVPGIIIAQCIGRWGNFFNQEAYGSVTTLNHLKSIFIPNFIIDGMNINGNYYLPTFYFESIWCLIGFIILITFRKNKSLKLGMLSGFYLCWYSFGRFFIESLREDSLMIFELKTAQVVSIIAFITGIILIIISNIKKINYNEK